MFDNPLEAQSEFRSYKGPETLPPVKLPITLCILMPVFDPCHSKCKTSNRQVGFFRLLVPGEQQTIFACRRHRCPVFIVLCISVAPELVGL